MHQTAAQAASGVSPESGIAAASRDLFGLHTTMRDTAWPTASLVALTVYLAMITMLVNLSVDVLYKLTDPRVVFK